MAEHDQPGDLPDSSVYFGPQRLVMEAFLSWQRIINQYTQELLSNRHVLDSSGRAVESAMQLKQQADRAMETVIASMQMPTKSDVELLMQKLSTLEGLVRDLNDKVDELLETREGS